MVPRVILPYLLFLLIIVCSKSGVNGQQSPCPDVFQYKFDGQLWHGIITLPSVGRGKTNLAVSLSVEDSLAQDNAGKIELLTDLNDLYAIVDSGGMLQYKNVFPISRFIPTIRSIKLNKREYCSNPAGPTIGVVSTVTVIHTIQTDINQVDVPTIQVPPPTQPPPPRPPIILPPPITMTFKPIQSPVGNTVSRLEATPISNTCGLRLSDESSDVLRPVHTIINGVRVEPGEYPWLAALYDQTRMFICGGNLVTNKHVITAAHCINHDWLIIELGRYDRENRAENVIIRISENIIKHPDYKENTGHADIAIMTFMEEVRFNDKIKPICLWTFGLDGIQRDGTVVGWGTDLSGDATPAVMQTTVKMVSQQTCVSSHALYRNITSRNTYCAGGLGSGPCKGDSGGGMYIKMQSRWYLRGIISTSLGGNDDSCNVNSYAVYADISTFLDWLKSNIV